MYRVLIFVFALAVSAIHGASLGSRIIGGDLAADGAHPYIASLRSFGMHFCGGAIVNQRWIVTAAHCLTSTSPTVLEVWVGSNQLNGGGDRYWGNKILIHPRYSSLLDRNDIGLLQVTQDIVFGEKVRPIPLPTEDFTKVDYPAVLSGWGATEFQIIARASNDLREVELQIIDQKLCLDRNVKTTNTNICTSTETNQGACHGDSGSPLVADGVLVGLVSYGTPCARLRPDVFTRVWSFVDWINASVN